MNRGNRRKSVISVQDGQMTTKARLSCAWICSKLKARGGTREMETKSVFVARAGTFEGASDFRSLPAGRLFCLRSSAEDDVTWTLIFEKHLRPIYNSGAPPIRGFFQYQIIHNWHIAEVEQPSTQSTALPKNPSRYFTKCAFFLPSSATPRSSFLTSRV